MKRSYIVSDIFKAIPESKDPHAQYQKKLKEYNDTIENIEQETKQPVTALEKHLLPFLDVDKSFSPKTISSILKAMHGTHADAKSQLIAAFNATHASDNIVCPAFKGYFKKDQNGYARFLHLGTTRIWNPDGTINEERMTALKSAVTSEHHNIVTLNKLKEYLARCLDKDPAVTTDGNRRNAEAGFSLTTKKMRISMQAMAATAAWDEVFDRLACGHDKEGKPYLTWPIVEDFFRDSPKVFLMAACGLLPVAAQKIESQLEASPKHRC